MGRLGDYSNGKIYKLISYETDTCYIGSTAEKLLSKRMAKHRCDHKRWLNKQDEKTCFKL